MSTGLSIFVTVVSILNILACWWLIRWTMKSRPGESAEGEVTGHTWDDGHLAELNNPLPRWWLLFCKLLAGVAVSILQVYVFLGIAALFGIVMPPLGYVAVFPVLILTGLMLGALGLLISSTIRQLENFAGVMNFVIFPMFFLSTALYPLWKMAESSPLLRDICALNPFTHAVELIRFAMYLSFNPVALVWVVASFAVFFAASMIGYDPAFGMSRKAPPGRG